VRYSLENTNGLIVEKPDYYSISVKNFRDKIGKPLGSSRRTLLTVGITKRYVEGAMRDGKTFLLGGLFGILPVEMPRITSAHRGLKRPMRVEQNSDADNSKYVVVMHPIHDCQLVTGANGAVSIDQTNPVGKAVFLATLTPSSKTAKYPDVDFWLEHCNWVDSEPESPQFPADYLERYENACLWTG
jgi:hypothetical protein